MVDLFRFVFGVPGESIHRSTRLPEVEFSNGKSYVWRWKVGTA